MKMGRGRAMSPPVKKPTFALDFEKPLLALESKIAELKELSGGAKIDFSDEIQKLERKAKKLQAEIFSDLTPWQTVQLARHPQRPYTLDYLKALFTDFFEVEGDRRFAADRAIVGGFARFDGQPVVVMGHQKGRTTKENMLRNFGMPRPEGYRKARRLFDLADRFRMPVIVFIDTPGAYPGIGAEERGQSEAIGRNLYEMAGLRVPIVVSVIGEGGSGGALAIAVGDATLMMQYSTYSVISPEGCAAILWKSPENASEAAECLGITAPRLKSLGLVDKVINEPLGGAHRDPAEAAKSLKKAIADHLRQLQDLPMNQLLERRQDRLVNYGKFKELAE